MPKITEFWMVQDPTILSVLDDIVWRQPIIALCAWHNGAMSTDGSDFWRRMHVCAYSTKSEALADARSRDLANRRFFVNDEAFTDLRSAIGFYLRLRRAKESVVFRHKNRPLSLRAVLDLDRHLTLDPDHIAWTVAVEVTS